MTDLLDVITGAAFVVWREVGGKGYPPDAAEQCAAALIELYAEVNDQSTTVAFLRLPGIASIRRHIGKSDRDLGMSLAESALHGAPEWASSKIEVPRYSVRLEGKDLVWEGDDATQFAGQGPDHQNPATAIPFRLRSCGTRICSLLIYLARTGLIYQYDYSLRGNEWIPEIWGAWPASSASALDDLNSRGEPRGHFTRHAHGLPLPNTREATAIKSKALDVIAMKTNPVGDQVHVIGGPARGRRGTVEHETEHVARVRFAEGGRGHVERGHLVPRGRAR